MRYRRIKMRKRFIFLWILFLLFAFSNDSYAVYYTLSSEQIRQAIEYGKKNKDADPVSFLDEWIRVSDSDNVYEWAGLHTKFSTLAYEAKKASQASKNLTEEQISQLLSEKEDILSFIVILYGNSYDFAQDYHAVLLYKNKPIQPVLEQNNSRGTASNLEFKRSIAYRAECRYEFPNYYVEPDAEVTLVILNPLNNEKRFLFRLGEMR
ncbi:MAG: hypothetical protein JETT_3021 [Candidatus Jettenia ecosi]|uniref:Uncharacterized protein n=1 Tax=Candidatus Jettenia ecosi TaxID=2494326 RepID=A0A533Q7V7_9BACT|nr:MAG: hypothetical protein JETT_3021 [Candidatus Jettenia ecosi]